YSMPCYEADVYRRVRFSRGGPDQIRVLAAALVLPQRRDLEHLQDGPVEGLARFRIADRQVDVVEDDPAPVPVRHAAEPIPSSRETAGPAPARPASSGSWADTEPRRLLPPPRAPPTRRACAGR